MSDTQAQRGDLTRKEEKLTTIHQEKMFRFSRLKRHYAACCGLSMTVCKEGCINVRLMAITAVLIKIHVFRQRVNRLIGGDCFLQFEGPTVQLSSHAASYPRILQYLIIQLLEQAFHEPSKAQ